MRSFDVAIIGLGGMGSAAAYHLARRGQRVLGLEAFQPGHKEGSSHGESRIIRQAYHEASEYVPLVQRAYTLWRELEAESGQADLLTITGGLLIGAPESEITRGALMSASLHNLPADLLSAREVAQRWPGFRLGLDCVAVHEPVAGILKPEKCVAAHLDLAQRRGAELHYQEPVWRWAVDGSGVRVTTAQADYHAERLIITAGPWAAELLADIQLPLSVERIVNVHFAPTKPELFTPDRCPIWILDVPEGFYYGMPSLEGNGMKAGNHVGQPTTVRTIQRAIDPAEIEALRQVVNRYMPGAAGESLQAFTCMYTNTPDRHFIIDQHPNHSQIAFGAGFSGHGFKFASVIGEILADLATKGETSHSIEFLSRGRAALNPTPNASN